MAFFSRFRKNKRLMIPGYTPLMENSVFVEDRQIAYPYHKYNVLAITRYSLPEKEEVIHYLQKRAKAVNRLRAEIATAEFTALHHNSLDLMLFSDFKMSKKLEQVDPKTEYELQNYFPAEINNNYQKADHDTAIYNKAHFCAVKKGIMAADDIEALQELGGKTLSQDWNNYFLSEQWSMDIYYDFCLPKRSELMLALKNKTSQSKIVRTTKIDNYDQEMEAVINPLYQYLHSYQLFLQWNDCSQKKLEEISLQIVHALHYNTFCQKQEQDYATVLSALLVNDGDKILN